MVGIPDGDQVGQGGFTQLTTFAQEFVKQFQYGNTKTRFGIFKYSDKPQTVLNLDQGISRRLVDDAVQRLSFSGGGNRIDEALKYADTTFAAGGRTNVKKFLVLLMNGPPSAGSSNLQVVAKSLSGFDVIPVAIGSPAKTESEKISKNYVHYESFDQLVSSGPAKIAETLTQSGSTVTTRKTVITGKTVTTGKKTYFD